MDSDRPTTYHLRPTTSYAWIVVAMLWMVCFLNYADRQVLSGIFPALEKEFGFSKFQLGMIGSIFMWVYASLVVFMGMVSDRVNRKNLILGGCLFWSLVTMLTGWCSLFWQFLAVRGLEGLGESCYFPSSNAMIADYHEHAHRSTALSFHQSGVYFGTIAGSAFGAWLAQHYGWRYGFYFFGGLGVIVSIILFFFLKEADRSHRHGAASQHSVALTFCDLMKRPELLFLIAAFVCVNMVAMIFLTWMPTFLYEKFHMTLTQAGFYSVIFIQLTSALSAPLCGWSGDWLTRKMKHGRLAVQVISLLVGTFAIIAIGLGTKFSLLAAMMILFGLCKSGYDAGIFGALFDYMEPNVRGSAAGLVISFGYFGGALGPLLLGAIATYGGASSSAIGRMSLTISMSGCAYFLGALFLLGVPVVLRKKAN
ncbi:MAG: MFS transporter [Verrucomicrobia bacterium]|nr:MFS transporter [Verrucomicrobiota bacterium]